MSWLLYSLIVIGLKQSSHILPLYLPFDCHFVDFIRNPLPSPQESATEYSYNLYTAKKSFRLSSMLYSSIHVTVFMICLQCDLNFIIFSKMEGVYK